MASQVLSTNTLKPSPSSPSNALIPLTVFDQLVIGVHYPVLFAFRPPTPSNAQLKDGLARALAHFPHLAGRISPDEEGFPCIVLNDAGIRLVEAHVHTTLAERMPLDPSPELSQLHPPVHGVEELLQIQLNRFSCGGLVIGASSHHRVADGHSMSLFFHAWSKLVRGLELDLPPCHDRAAISAPRNPPKYEINHQAVEFEEITIPCKGARSAASDSSCLPPVENLVVRFSADFLTKLKTHVAHGDLGRRYSTFECLLVHLWKKITVARGLQEDEMTRVRISVNGRPRMVPRVPTEYFGNLVLWAYPKLQVGELVNGSYASAAKTIHDAVAQLDDAYFKSFIDFVEQRSKASGGESRNNMAAPTPEVGTSLSPDLEVDSWLRLHFHELDFGTGEPCDFTPPFSPLDGLLEFVPSCKEKGGIDAFISLFPDQVNHFKQICQAFD
ncbi:hypothetical protein ACLOJK_039405 [Asimina triloba]